MPFSTQSVPIETIIHSQPIHTGGAKLHVQLDVCLLTATEHWFTLVMWVQVDMTTETGEWGSIRQPFGLSDHGWEGKAAQTFDQD